LIERPPTFCLLRESHHPFPFIGTCYAAGACAIASTTSSISPRTCVFPQ
jgi:hypothetical protein